MWWTTEECHPNSNEECVIGMTDMYVILHVEFAFLLLLFLLLCVFLTNILVIFYYTNMYKLEAKGQVDRHSDQRC
jgi:hypothetical protein